MSGNANGETVQVSAFGYTQTYSGVTEIVGNMGDNTNQVNIIGVEVPVHLTGGKGNNTFVDNGNGPAVLDISAENSTSFGYIETDANTTTVTITGGAGTDEIIHSGLDAATINAGSGTSTINSNVAGDDITGNSGQICINVDGGNAAIYPGSGQTVVNWPLAGSFGTSTIASSTSTDVTLSVTNNADNYDINVSNPGDYNVEVTGSQFGTQVGAIKADDLSELDIAAGTGADQITFSALNGSNLPLTKLDLGQGSTAGKTVTVEGSTGNDHFTVAAIDPDASGAMQDVQVTDIGVTTIDILNSSQSIGDTLIVNGEGGSDILDASELGDAADTAHTYPDLINIQLIAGTGNSTLIGGPYNEILEGGQGQDIFVGGGAHDTFITPTTDNTLIENQNADMSLFGNDFVIGSILNSNGGPYSTSAPLSASLPDTNITNVGEYYAAGANVENILDMFTTVDMNGGLGNNTLVVGSKDGVFYVGGTSMAVSPWAGTVTLDNGGNTANGDTEYYIVNGDSVTGTTVNISPAAGETGSSELLVNGTNGPNNMTLGASASGAAGTGTIIFGVPTQAGHDTINFQKIQRLTIDGWGDNNVFNVQATPAGVPTTIIGGKGSSTFNISSNAADNNGTLTNNGNLLGIQGTLFLDGGTGKIDRMYISNVSGAASTDMVQNAVTLGGAPFQCITGFAPANIYYETAGSFDDTQANDGIVLTGSDSGDDFFNIQTTLAGSTTTILGVGANETVNVSSDADSAGGVLTNDGNLLGIVGTLTDLVDAGTANRLVISNFGGAGELDVLQTAASVNGQPFQLITGLAPASIYYGSGGGTFFDQATSSGITVRGSSTGNDTFNIQSTLAGSITVYQANGDSAVFNVNGTFITPSRALTSLLRGPLVLYGGSTNDTYNIVLSGFGTTYIDDQGGPGTHVATITNTLPNAPMQLFPNLLERTGEQVSWDSNLQQITFVGVNLASGYGSANTAVVAPSPNTAIQIDGNSVPNPSGLPRIISLDLANLPASMLYVTGPGAGTLITPGYQNLSFENFDQITAVGGLLNVLIDGNSDTASGLHAGDGIFKDFSANMQGGLLQLYLNGVLIYLGDLAAVGSINVNGSTDDDILSVDNNNGLISTVINFNGGSQGHHLLAVYGGNVSTYAPNPTVTGSGVVTTTSGAQSQTINFQDLTPVYLFNQAVVHISLGNDGDVVTIDSPNLSSLPTADQNAITAAGLGNGQFNRITGTTKGVPFEAVYFGNDGEVDLDCGSTSPYDPNGDNDDSITIASSGLVAAKLQIFSILGAAAGNDTLNVDCSSYSLPVSGGGISFIGGNATNTINADAAVNFTLTNSGLTSSAGGTIFLAGVNVANLTGSDSTYNISGWKGVGSLTDTAGTVVDSGPGDFTLSNLQIYRDDVNGHTMTLSGITNADLTDTTGGHTFSLNGWSGTTTLTNASGTTSGTVATPDTVAANNAANYVLTDTQLTINGQVTGLAGSGGFNTANLVSTGGGHSFDVSGWTHGGSLTGAGNPADPDTVSATKNADFTLTNTTLTSTDLMSMSLSGIAVATLIATVEPHSFTLDNNGVKWTGTGSLTSSIAHGTVITTRNANFTLGNTVLNTSDGMSMTLSGIIIANLTATTAAATFNLNNGSDYWTGQGTLWNQAGSGTVNNTAPAGFTLTDTSLSSTDGMSMTLKGTFGTANLTDTQGGNTFTVSGWTAAGTLANTSSPVVGDTVVASKAASFTLTNTSLTSTDNMSLNLTGLFGTAKLTDTQGGDSFTVSGWTGHGTLANTSSPAVNDTVIAVKAASYTLSNTSLSSTDNMSLTLSGLIGTADLTDTQGGHTFTVSGWTGNGTLANTSSPAASDTVIAVKAAGYTLTNTSLTSTDGMSLLLTGLFGTANLTDTQGGNSFTVSGWTGNGTLANTSSPAVSDTIIAVKAGGYTLTNASLTSTDSMSLILTGLFGTADLTDTQGGHTFTVSGWTGNGTMANTTSPAVNDTLVAVKAAGYTLTNTSLASTDGMSLTLSGLFSTANLTDTQGNHTFTVSGWTGNGTMTDSSSPAVSDTVTATKAASFTLTNTSLTSTDSMSLILTGRFGTANLTDTQGGHTFTVSGWTGNGSLADTSSPAVNDTVIAVKAASFVLTNTSLTSTDNMSLNLSGLIGTANLTDTQGGHSFTVSGWTGNGTLANTSSPATSDTVIAVKAASYTLTNTSLTSTDGMSLILTGLFGTADLTDTQGGNSFTVSGWTGNGTLANTSSPAGSDTVIAVKAAGYTLTNSSLTSTDSMSLILTGLFGTADLTDTHGGHIFTVSGWTGNGTMANTTSPAVNDTIVAVKAAGYTLTNTSLASTDGMSLTLSGLFGTADLTDTQGGNAFTVSGWTGNGTLANTSSPAVDDTVVAVKPASFTLTNTSLTSTNGMSLLLSGLIGTANLTDTQGGNTFTVSGWTGNGSLANTSSPAVNDTVIAIKAASYTLTNTSLTSTDGMSMTLSGLIGTANLTDTLGGQTFTVSGWTGNGTLANTSSPAVSDTVIAVKAAGYTLTNTSLTSTDGMSLILTGLFGTADLTDTQGGHSFTVSGWTGNGTLANTSSPAVNDTVIAVKAAGYTLTNTSLTSTDGMSLTLTGLFGTADLTDTQGGNTFTVSGWTGNGTLANTSSPAASDTIVAVKAAGYTLTNTSLTSTDGMSLTLTGLFGTADLTDTQGGNTFTVSGWTGNGTLANTSSPAVNDTVVAVKPASFTLTDTSLTSTDGMSLILSGLIGTSDLTDTEGGNTFTVSGWTGNGSLANTSSPAVSDTVIAVKAASYTLTNISLTSTDGMSLTLSGLIGTADLTDTVGGQTFTVSGWTGNGTLANTSSPAVSDTIIAVKAAGYTLTNTSLTSTDGMSLTLTGLFGTADLTDTHGGHSFTVSGWTGNGTLANTSSPAVSDTIIAVKAAGYLLTNTSLSSTDGMSLTLTGLFGTADLTDTHGSNKIYVSGWTGDGTLANTSSPAVSDTIVAVKAAGYTLANTSLTSTDGMSLTLTGLFGTADLTDTQGGNTFTVSGWTGNGELANTSSPAVNDTVVAVKPASFTLTNNSLASTDGMSLNLSGLFGTANLTDTLGGHSFVVSGWTGNGSLADTSSPAVNDTIVAVKAAGYTLTNASLTSTDGMALTLSGHIGTANLTDTLGGHTFTVSGWTGNGTLANTSSPAVSDTIVAVKPAGYTLTNTSLASTDGMALNLSGLFGTANLTDTQGGHNFTVSGWTGNGTLANTSSPATGDTVIATKAAGYTLANTSLTSTDGMTLALTGLFTTAALTDTLGGRTFTVSSWTGTGTLANASSPAVSDTIVAVKPAGYTLTNTSLASTDGMSLTLVGLFGTANLTDTQGGNTFTVSGWTGNGSITGSNDTLVATKDANFTFTTASLSTSDGMQLNLAGITTATLTGGPSDNVFNITASPTVTVYVNGAGATIANVLNFNGQGNALNFGANEILATGDKPVIFSNMQKLTYSDPALSADQRFIQSLYFQELGRLGSIGEIDAWVTTLQQPGQSDNTVAVSIDHSTEALTDLVNGWYLTYLGRAAVNGEQQGWVSMLQNGATEESVQSQILASAEFANRANAMIGSASASANYVQALYRILLGRNGSTSDVNGWVAVVQNAGSAAVALDFLQSGEYRGITVAGYYIELLHRQAGVLEIDGWTGTPFDLLSIRENIESSAEFYLNG